LFVYFTDASDTSALTSADKSTSVDTTLTAFVGTLPGAYPVSRIGRVQIHMASAVVGASRDDTRDVTLRIRN
jgi:hypothetical protein